MSLAIGFLMISLSFLALTIQSILRILIITLLNKQFNLNCKYKYDITLRDIVIQIRFLMFVMIIH